MVEIKEEEIEKVREQRKNEWREEIKKIMEERKGLNIAIGKEEIKEKEKNWKEKWNDKRDDKLERIYEVTDIEKINWNKIQERTKEEKEKQKKEEIGEYLKEEKIKEDIKRLESVTEMEREELIEELEEEGEKNIEETKEEMNNCGRFIENIKEKNILNFKKKKKIIKELLVKKRELDK